MFGGESVYYTASFVFQMNLVRTTDDIDAWSGEAQVTKKGIWRGQLPGLSHARSFFSVQVFTHEGARSQPRRAVVTP